MLILEYTLLIFVSIFIVIFSFLFLLKIINSTIYRVPHVATFGSDIEVMKKWLKKYPLKGKKIVDLWSGTGKIVRFFEKEFGAISYWYEVDLSNHLISKLINKITNSKCKVYKKSYYDINLSWYQVIYVYLFPEIIDKIESKIWQESDKWTIIISNAFKFKNKIPIEILKNEKWKEELYMYEV